VTRRVVVVTIGVLLVLAALTSVTDGFDIKALGFRIAVHSPFRPLLVSTLLLGGYLAAFGLASLVAESEWLAGVLRIVAARLAAHGLWIIVILFVGIVASYRGFIPYWDAQSYFNCIAYATGLPFDLLNFRCVNHPSVVYLFLLGLAQYVAPWNASLMYGINAILGVGSIAAFHALLGLLFPKRSATEYALVTALFAFAPLFVAHAIFLNLDYGMTVFFVMFLYFLVARRWWAANVSAIAMMFSKEIGAAAFMVTIPAYIVAFTLSRPSWKERFLGLRLLAPLTATPLVLVIYVVFFHVSRSNPGSWLEAYLPMGAVQDRLDLILNTNLADAGMRSYLADIFVLNFQWLYSGSLIAAMCAMVLRTAETREGRVAVEGSGRFLALVLVGLVYVVTRYRGYNNARYVLIVSPILILVSYRAMLSVCTNGVARRALLSGAAALVLLSNFRTLDVGSKLAFGTFNFGSHALLDMPSLMGGSKLDSIVYNLEALQFHYLVSDVMQDLRPAPHAVIFMGDTTYNFPAPVDEHTYALTLDPARALPLSILSGDGDVQRAELRKHLTGDGDRFFYMAFANADNHQLRMLLERYPLSRTTAYERSGYRLDVYTFWFSSIP
jgi:hypothetical protein